MTLTPTRTKTRPSSRQLRGWMLAAVLLAGVAGAKLALFRKPPEADPYFQRVAAVAAKVPTSFGSWVSIEAPVPQAAQTMLKPNVLVSRRYTNLDTGEQATLLLVQCGDARDLRGHYPPVCYRSSGFKQTGGAPKDWQFPGLSVQGMVYSFASERASDLSSMVIYDFMIMPNGLTCRDMNGIEALSSDPQKRQLGAAQLQILLDPSMPEERRDAVFRALVQAYRPTLDAILAGDHL